MRIGFASADWAGARVPLERPTYGGSGWARCGQVAQEIRRQDGVDVFEGTLIWHAKSQRFGVRQWPSGSEPQDPEDLYALDLDVIVLQRWMQASVAFETESAQRSGQVVIQDVDDHFWALQPTNRAYYTTDPRLNPIENRAHYLEALKRASLVTVSTPYLADALRRLGVRTQMEVLRNQIDLSSFRLHGRGGRRPTIGWVGATSHRSGDLEELRGVLQPFLEKHDLLAFHGGRQDEAESFAHQAGVNPARVAEANMVPIDLYPTLFDHLDIGLVPLRGVPFNRAKSWIKGLEYAASGIPFVASDLPEYRELHDRWGIGRLASKRKHWLRHLEDLLDDDVYVKEAQVQRERVAAFDIQHGVGHWAALYLECAARA